MRAVSRPASSSPERSRKKQLRVVIADDSATLRQMLTRLCQRLPGLEVVGEAPDGLQAVKTVRQLQPDLLILDLKLPRLGGLEVLQALKAEAVSPIVIIWTGLPPEMVGDQWRALGAQYFFVKGQQVHELTQTLQGLAADAGH
jgi:DNA-binding NarL/FixJ family response regulator